MTASEPSGETVLFVHVYSGFESFEEYCEIAVKSYRRLRAKASEFNLESGLLNYD